MTDLLHHEPRPLFGLDVAPLSMEQVVELADDAVHHRERLLVAVVNAAKVVKLRHDPLLRDSVLDADVILADGQAVVWASRLLRRPLPERVAGIDLCERLLGLADREGLRVFLLGARPEVLAGVCAVIAERWPGVVVAGARDGYFAPDEAGEVAEVIAGSGADLLFIGMPTPAKETFLARYGDLLGVPVLHGVGGSFDVIAGVTRRAPELWQRWGMEWAYRLLQEPGRLWKRYLVTNVAFCGLLLRELVHPTPPYATRLDPNSPHSQGGIRMNELFTGRVAILGLGYIGLPTAAALATRGVDVVGVDVNEATVKAVANGEVPFVEPDLSAAVSGAVAMGKLTASTHTPQADAFIIAVPTPFCDDHRADLSFVRSAVEQIAPVLRGDEVVILESTSPPGTSESISQWLGELRPDLVPPHSSEGVPDVHVAHCPERVLPGRIMIEMVTNDRVVGGITPRCAEKAAAIYRVFCQGEILLTDAASAEMAKLVENAYRDVNIAFANELSLISEDLELDVWEVIKLANHHPRVNVLTPGPGVGGHCIAVDPWFIVGAAPSQSRLIRVARDVNDDKPRHVADQVVHKSERFHDPTVACLGLAYKANVDDLRESPAVDIVEMIAAARPDLDIRVAEPLVKVLPERLAAYPNVRLEPACDAIAAADIVALLVDHDHFRSLSRSRLSGKVVYDTRGLWRQS